MSSAKSDTFTSSFPIWIPFISFTCLISLAKNFRTMLNKSGASGHSCFVPAFTGKSLSFSPLSFVLAEDLSYADFILLR